jgi:hypothetical protein
MTTLARGTTVELMRTDATDSCRSTNARRLRLLHQVRRDPLVRVPSERDEAHRLVTVIGRAAGDLAVVGVVVVAPEHELADELESWPTPPGSPSLRLLTGPAGRLHRSHRPTRVDTPAWRSGPACGALFADGGQRRQLRRPPRGPPRRQALVHQRRPRRGVPEPVHYLGDAADACRLYTGEVP